MQADLFSQPTGQELAQAGAKRAATHAERVEPGWNQQCYSLLLTYLSRIDRPFITEDFRMAIKDIIAPPPDLRAYSSIILKAAKAGLIKKIGYSTAKNPVSHAHPCTLWQKI